RGRRSWPRPPAGPRSPWPTAACTPATAASWCASTWRNEELNHRGAEAQRRKTSPLLCVLRASVVSLPAARGVAVEAVEAGGGGGGAGGGRGGRGGGRFRGGRPPGGGRAARPAPAAGVGVSPPA